ncbi:RES family NAD+ phosphorylase [bacterium]|nr:RES family NAD+ phosphorylase [bacterium]
MTSNKTKIRISVSESYMKAKKMYDNWKTLSEKDNKFFDNFSLCYHFLGEIQLKKGTICHRARAIKKEEETELLEFIYAVDENDVDPETLNKTANYTDGILFKGFDADGCFAPKDEKVEKDGRFNKVHESVLYMSNNPHVAVMETRPSIEQYINIAEIKVLDDLRLLNLIHYPAPKNPNDIFMAINDLVCEMCATSEFVLNGDYSFTQTIAEFAKGRGFDGIAYNSAMIKNKENYCIFSDKKHKCEAISSKVLRVGTIESRSIDIYNWDLCEGDIMNLGTCSLIEKRKEKDEVKI